MSKFHDHFSAVSDEYARYRPTYPDALFEFLARNAPGTDRAWDCATGTGQSAVGLASYFNQVIATDASQDQIDQAQQHDNVSYRVATAYSSGLDDHSVNLVTASQALHWFDFDLFFTEVKRILTPGGLLAAWCYDVPEIPDIPQDTMLDLYYGALEPYWPPERKYVDARYQTIEFPFPEVQNKQFTMQEFWNFHEFSGYVSTWSASKEYIAANDRDAWEKLLVPLQQEWGDAGNKKHIAWPVHMRTARTEASSE